MASVCKVHLVGNVGKDPEVRFSAAGKPVANATLATSSRRKDKSGEIVGEYVKKGSLIYVEGTIKYEKYVNKSGVEVNATTIICNEMTILKRPENKPEKYEGLPKLEDDEQIPF
jgi:single-strand DNA-binding protein